MTSTSVSQPLPSSAASAATVQSRHQRRRLLPLLVIIGASWLVLITVAALLADVLPLSDPNVDVGKGVYTAPFQDASQFLGTDGLGRSILSRAVYGARVSLVAGAISLTIAFAI